MKEKQNVTQPKLHIRIRWEMVAKMQFFLEIIAREVVVRGNGSHKKLIVFVVIKVENDLMLGLIKFVVIFMINVVRVIFYLNNFSNESARIVLYFGKDSSLIKAYMLFGVLVTFDFDEFGSVIMVGINNIFFD